MSWGGNNDANSKRLEVTEHKEYRASLNNSLGIIDNIEEEEEIHNN